MLRRCRTGSTVELSGLPFCEVLPHSLDFLADATHLRRYLLQFLGVISPHPEQISSNGPKNRAHSDFVDV